MRSRSAGWLAVLLLALAASAEDGMRFPGEAWAEAAPADEGVDAARLQTALDYLEANSGGDGVKQVVIARRGTLIWRGPKVHIRHGVWSVTKSFTSTVLGLLVDDGAVALDTRAAELHGALAAAYPTVTLRHFTTMTSGYRAVGDEPQGAYLHGPSKSPFEPHPEPLFAPGDAYAYWDSAMNELGHLLTLAAGEPLRDLFQRRIGDPIGLAPDAWSWGEVGEVNGVTVNGGAGNLGQHVRINALEIARLGHLYLNRGEWSGKRLLSEAWIDAATRNQVSADLPMPESSGADGRGVYGFNWWTNAHRADGTRLWPAAPPGTFAAKGYNNNLVFVIPEWQMVVVRLGLDAQTDGAVPNEVWSRWLGYMGEAVER